MIYPVMLLACVFVLWLLSRNIKERYHPYYHSHPHSHTSYPFILLHPDPDE